jgi:hypothetical protein
VKPHESPDLPNSERNDRIRRSDAAFVSHSLLISRPELGYEGVKAACNGWRLECPECTSGQDRVSCNHNLSKRDLGSSAFSDIKQIRAEWTRCPSPNLCSVEGQDWKTTTASHFHTSASGSTWSRRILKNGRMASATRGRPDRRTGSDHLSRFQDGLGQQHAAVSSKFQRLMAYRLPV